MMKKIVAVALLFVVFGGVALSNTVGVRRIDPPFISRV